MSVQLRSLEKAIPRARIVPGSLIAALACQANRAAAPLEADDEVSIRRLIPSELEVLVDAVTVAVVVVATIAGVATEPTRPLTTRLAIGEPRPVARS